jgi:monoamine oxidase
MATPHVTGTVALMFEAAPRRLRIEETHNLLLASAERVSVPEDIPDRVGIGYLDIEEAVKAARQLGSVSPILKQVGTEKPTLAKPGTNGKAAPIKPEAEIMTTEGPKAEVAEGLAEHAAAEASTESKEGFFAPAEIGRKDAPAGSGIRPTDADLRALLSSPDCQKRLKGLHVAVVGGGFAGLMAARMLGQHGIKVTLFEARTEVGGRVRSNHTFSTGRIIEEGAELVGSFHTTWLRLALEYRLGMISRMDEHLYALEGLTTKITLDKDLSIKEAKDLNDAMRTRVLEPLAHLADKEIKDPSQPWLEPGLNKFDGMTVEDALPKFCQIAKRIKGNPDEELWRMLEFKLVNDEVGPLDTMNFLGLLCKIKAGQGKRLIDVSSVGCKVESGKCVITDPKLMGYWDELEIFRCADGCQQLALEMKKEIINKHNGDIHLRTAVKVIDISKKDIQLRWASVIDDKEPAVGTENSGHFDFVILAIPPSVWDRVTFIADGGIVTIGTMGMSPAVKFFSETDSRFWIDSRLAPYGGALTLGQIWEGTDNQTRTGQQKIVVSVFAGPIIDDRGSRRAPTKDECNDRLHKHFDGFTSTKAPLYSNWPQEPFIRTGYASPRLHDVFILGKLLNEPFYDLMFFAGEHTRMDFFGYMEGALRSGEDASRLLMWQACSQLSKAPAQSSTTPVRRSKEGDSESATQNGEKAAGSCGCQHREAALQAAQGEALEREAADFVDWSEQKSTERGAGVETESFFSSELVEVSARQRESDLVEMADQIVAEQTSAGRATPILHEMLSRAGLAEALTVPGSERLPLAAEIFDSLAYPCRSALRELLELVFEVVSAPGSVLNRALQPGDLQIRRALGEGPLAHVALLATGDVLRAEQLALAGLRPESPQSGLYVQVVDGGVYAHGTEARFARRLTRSDGRLDWDQMVLRIRPEALPSQAMPRIRGESSERSGSPEDAADHEYPDFGSFTPPAESVPMDVVFDDIDSTVTPPEMRPRRISTAADLRARPQQHEFEDSAHKKLLFLFGEAAFATPFYRDVGGNIEIALRSRVMFPADPADAGKLAKSNRPFPVALIVHGNHAAFDSFSYVKDGREATFPDGTKIPVVTVTNVTPVDSFMGYHFLQVELARHGIVSMSVDHDAANFLDLLVTTRAELVMQYLDQLRRLAENKASPFYNRLDFQKVALIGHSRGGDGVIASLQVNARRPDKNQFGVQSIVALAPSDMTGSLVDRQQLKIGPARGEKLLVVYGSYDGDISGFCGSLEFTGTGFRHYDRSSTHRAMVFIHRACHNRFNTLWGTESDVPADVIEASSHHHLAQEYIGGWLRMLLYGEWAQEGLFTGATANRLAQPVSLQWKFGRKLQTIDRMDDNDDIHNTLGGSVTKPSYVREIVIATEGPLNFPHQDRVLKADVPTGKPAPYRSSIPAANRDFSQFELLTFRITKKYPIDSQKAINDAPWPDFTITLEDGDGNRGSISGARILDLNKRKTKPVFRTMIDNSCTGDGSVVTQNITKINLETWQVPLSLFRSLPKFNLADIQAVEFDFRAVAGQPILVDTISLVKI